MIIGYQNGTAVEAKPLTHGNDELRVAVQGEDDACAFRLTSGRWISEQGEPVRIEFAWERSTPADVPDAAECIWPAEGSTGLGWTPQGSDHTGWAKLWAELESEEDAGILAEMLDEAKAAVNGKLRTGTVYLRGADLERPDCITALLQHR